VGGPDGVGWDVIDFPKEKPVREAMIADLFVRGANERIQSESAGDKYTPFGVAQPNKENDLDFTIATAVGTKLMELAEFAPLQEFGRGFENAPRSLNPGVKCDSALGLVKDKSDHQGGKDRLLLLYHTEYGFFLDPMAIELMRRVLSEDHPRFERVYYVSPFMANVGVVTEIYPGTPHHIYRSWSDEQLRGGVLSMPHPMEMLAVSE